MKIRAEGISRSIRGRAILRDLSLSIEAGEWVSLVGASGSGKTTLLHLLALLDVPDAGRVMLGDDIASAWSVGRRALARGRQIGLVFQDGNLFEHMTARDNVALPARLCGRRRSEALAAADELLARFGVRECAETRASALSMGEAQRVALARAIINRPAVVLLDEPTGSLDEVSGALVLDALRTYHAEGGTLLVVTHDANVAARASRTLTMRDGAISSS